MNSKVLADIDIAAVLRALGASAGGVIQLLGGGDDAVDKILAGGAFAGGNGGCSAFKRGGVLGGKHLVKGERIGKRTGGAQQKQSNGTPRAMIVFGIVIAVIVIYMLIPRIVNIITMAGKQTNPEVEQSELENEVFNPYTPITIVPNDYQE